MKKLFAPLSLCILFFWLVSSLWAQGGVFLGPQAGYSRQKPSLGDIEFIGDAAHFYGLRAGIKVMIFAVEINYFRATHDLTGKDNASGGWEDQPLKYNYLGLNFKYFFPILFVHPFATFGLGYYTAHILENNEDQDRGFNLGLGLEIHLGKKFSVLAEGKYHHANLELDEMSFRVRNFTIGGGINIYF